ncbi:hypothetical protein EV356DRAFT_501006 [Viridothelium virens]|uniref:Thioesterase domain-containing protein n=1 Tax=Viridothelium virens TaxID=1048519 RepID=A0A6A6HC25_VIRVR|nr:hypothetical protein EV356DRAFT_501006 [Viridothelium virens]
MTNRRANPHAQNTGRSLDYAQSQFENFWGSPQAEAEERIRHVLRFFTENSSNKDGSTEDRFETAGLRLVTLKSASLDTRSATFSLTIPPQLCSKFRTLHGAASAMLLDMLTSACLSMIAKPGYLDAGHVTRSLIMTYLRPVQEGEKVEVECRIVATGKHIVNLSGEIKTLDGKICVSCVHDKVILEKAPPTSKL